MSDFELSLSEFKDNLKEIKESSARIKMLKTASAEPATAVRVARSSNDGKFLKVAYNLYKAEPNFYDDREFWKISDDGEHFMRVFNDTACITIASNDSGWTSHNDDENISLEYKGSVITSMHKSKFGDLSDEDVIAVRGTLIRKAAQDNNFAIKLMQEFSPDREKFIRNAYPELF